MANKKVEFLGNTLTSAGIKRKGDICVFPEKEAISLQTLSTVKSPEIIPPKVGKNDPKRPDSK